MQTSEVYSEIEVQAIRLSEGNKKLLSLEEVLSEYILPELSTKEQIELSRVIAEKRDIRVAQILENIKAIRKAIKILALMEASDNIEEFKKLADKQKKQTTPEKKEEPTEWDKLIGAFLEVPKKDLKNHSRHKK